MPPKPTPRLQLAGDIFDGKVAEKKDSPVAETGKAPRPYSPPIFSSAPASGRLTRFGLFTGCSDQKPNLQYLVIRALNVLMLPKPS